MEYLMYLENDVKWHRAPLLSSIAFIPTRNKNTWQQHHTKFAGITEFLYEKFLSSKSASQGMRTLESNKSLPPIRLEISIEKINDLLRHKQICAADVRCLDSNSKQCLAKLCLQNCL